MKIVAVSFGSGDDATIADVLLASVQSTPAYQVFDLMDEVEAYQLSRRTARALENPLERAVQALTDTGDGSPPERIQEACETFDRFGEELSKSASALTAVQIADLGGREMAIQTTLGCVRHP